MKVTKAFSLETNTIKLIQDYHLKSADIDRILSEYLTLGLINFRKEDKKDDHKKVEEDIIKKIVELEQKNEKINKEKIILKNNLEKIEEENQKYKKRNKELEEENQKYKKRNKELEEENQKLKKEITEIKNTHLTIDY